MDRQDGIALVLRLAQEYLQLEPLDPGLQFLQLAEDFCLLALFCKFGKVLQVPERIVEFIPLLDDGLFVAQRLGDRLRFLLIIPNVWFGCFLGKFLYLLPPPLYVKGSLSASPPSLPAHLSYLRFHDS